MWAAAATASTKLANEKISQWDKFHLDNQGLSTDSRAGSWIIDQQFNLEDKTCNEWLDAFDAILHGIDWSRTATLTETHCYQHPTGDMIQVRMLIEPWTNDDIDYVNSEVSKRQGASILDDVVYFKQSIGVVNDIYIDYLDHNGDKVSPLLNQHLTVGGINLHTTLYDLDLATSALFGDIDQDFLPYVEKVFGSEQAKITKYFLQDIKSISLSSEVRFLFHDYSATKWLYHRYNIELDYSSQ